MNLGAGEATVVVAGVVVFGVAGAFIQVVVVNVLSFSLTFTRRWRQSGWQSGLWLVIICVYWIPGRVEY